jgi:glycosyltransferase involved in cell wall biosynthesis
MSPDQPTRPGADAAEGVTLVIPGKNSAHTLPACLGAVVPLLGKDGLQEIIFVDDGSTDDTPAVVAPYPVRYVKAGAGGPGHARNVGWRAARTPLVWFIDSDCVAEPDALRLLLDLMKDPGVAGAGGSYGNLRPESLLACLIHEEMVERHLRMSADVDYLASYNVVYRREVLEQVGGFDEGNYNGPGAPGAEDIELAFRLHDGGHRLRFDRTSLVGHFHPTRLWRYLRSQRYHGYFRVWLYRHHFSRAGGDAYSGVIDHAQPPLALLTLVTLPLLFWWPLALVPAVTALLLLLAQLPMTVRLVRRTRSARYAWFAGLSFVRAFSRAIGMSLAAVEVVAFPRAREHPRRPVAADVPAARE